MPRLLVYVIKSDKGKAPKIEGNTCVLHGCMEDIEKNAEIDDWIIGIGAKDLGRSKGNRGQYDRKLIYAMKVQRNINSSPKSKEFYFFGNNAIEIPEKLSMLRPEKNRFRVKYFYSTESTVFSVFESFIRCHQIGSHGQHCDKSEKQTASKCHLCSKNRIC
jgi:hypothetical protein